MITFGTKFQWKLIYTLVNLIINTLQNLLKFYFWFLTVILIARLYLVQSERSALMVAIKDVTQGHASTSVYTKTPKKNNHLDILTPKVNIFGQKKLACHEWEKTKLILAQAKSATCKTPEAMKQQQEAAAKKNPEG